VHFFLHILSKNYKIIHKQFLLKNIGTQ